MGDWPLYLEGILTGDSYAFRFWSFIQNHPTSKDITVLFITNDDGRHSDGWSNGFVSHGDNCDGCRHINFMALGAGIRKGHIDTTSYSQNDIASTIARILGIQMPHGTGQVMEGIGEDVFTERLAVPLLPEVMVWLTDEVEIEYVKV